MPATRISRLGFVNCYLVSEDDGLTLVDTMLPRSAGKIVAAAERLGRDSFSARPCAPASAAASAAD